MRLLAPRIELQGARGGAARRGRVPVPLVIRAQGGQCVQHALMEGFAPRQRPLLERRAVLQEELLQELAAIEVRGLLQARGANGAVVEACMRMGSARRQMG